MRQSNQKSRSRGRGRKPQNPMSKNFESNGPDVKIRGNASHIAEKYSTLARDAQSNGDTVMAENYYQHAEHYNRIIAIAQQQNQQRAEEAAANAQANGRGPQPEVENNTAEQPANGETAEAADANASEQGNAEDNNPVKNDGEAKPKRNGRGRKPKSDIAASESVVEADIAVDVDETASVEVISDDAAKLPGSIIGETTVEEA